ncbi:hypothetical protein FACS1894199_01330 [Bacteroidia bacterium]|nr:hypothetical protein FACS1894199_01330 [Bacteroidia bacterium]
MKTCKQPTCQAVNIDDANYCIACGTCLVDEKTLSIAELRSKHDEHKNAKKAKFCIHCGILLADTVPPSAPQKNGGDPKIWEPYLVALQDYPNTGDYYKGETQDSKPHGKGIIFYQNGDWWEGEFVDGKVNGFGTYYSATYKRKDSGEYENDGRIGKGRIEFEDRVYDGEWNSKGANGKGIYTSNGEKLDGNFVDNVFNRGKHYFKDGSYADGSFDKDGKLHGIGVYYDFKCKRNDTGEYTHGIRTGKGKIELLDSGRVLEGKWNDNGIEDGTETDKKGHTKQHIEIYEESVKASVQESDLHINMTEMTEVARTWDCGEDADSSVIATLSYGTLTISGKGAMKNYSAPDDSPWYSSSDFITAVVIEQGITSIGDYAFAGCAGLKSIYAKSEVAASLGNCAFSNVDKTACILYVLSGAQSAYRTANGWQEFKNIEEREADEEKAKRALDDLSKAKLQIKDAQTAADFAQLSRTFSWIAEALKSLPSSFKVKAQVEECENLYSQCQKSMAQHKYEKALDDFTKAKLQINDAQTVDDFALLNRTFSQIAEDLKSLPASLPSSLDVPTLVKDCLERRSWCEEKITQRKAQRKYEEALAEISKTKLEIKTAGTAADCAQLIRTFSRIAEDLKSLPSSFDVQAQVKKCEKLSSRCEKKKTAIEKDTPQRRKAAKERTEKWRKIIGNIALYIVVSTAIGAAVGTLFGVYYNISLNNSGPTILLTVCAIPGIIVGVISVRESNVDGCFLTVIVFLLAGVATWIGLYFILFGIAYGIIAFGDSVLCLFNGNVIDSLGNSVSSGSSIFSAVVGGGVAGSAIGAIIGSIREEVWGFLIFVLLLVAVGTFSTVKNIINQPNQPTSISTKATVTATVTARSLNLRSAPNTESKVLTSVKKGTTLTVIGDISGTWIRVEYGGKQGYVDKKYVSIGFNR